MSAPKDIEDIALLTFNLIKERIYGDSVVEKRVAVKVMLNVLGIAKITKHHTKLIEAVRAANDWQGQSLTAEAADAVENIKAQRPR